MNIEIRRHEEGVTRGNGDEETQRQGCWVLCSADFFIITSRDDMLIFYLTESIFFHGGVIRDINEKGLHILDASVTDISGVFGSSK